MGHPLWSDKETEIITKMVEAKKSIGDIMKVLKSRSERAIIIKCKELGLPVPGGPEIDFEAFKELMRGK